MTTITLNASLDTQVRSIAQQARASVDEIVNDNNMQQYTRTQIWNLVSLLEKI